VERWATLLFRLLWVLLVVFLVSTAFTICSIAYSCVQLYELGPILPFVPGMILGLVSLLFAGWAICMVTRVGFWKIHDLTHKLDAEFHQADTSKRQISLEDRSLS